MAKNSAARVLTMVVVDGDDEAARFTLTCWEQRLQQRGQRVVFVALDHNRTALLGIIETEDTMRDSVTAMDVRCAVDPEDGTTTTTVCACESCEGQACQCGCQNRKADKRAGCQCGEVCNCGTSCSCKAS